MFHVAHRSVNIACDGITALPNGLLSQDWRSAFVGIKPHSVLLSVLFEGKDRLFGPVCEARFVHARGLSQRSRNLPSQKLPDILRARRKSLVFYCPIDEVVRIVGCCARDFFPFVPRLQQLFIEVSHSGLLESGRDESPPTINVFPIHQIIPNARLILAQPRIVLALMLDLTNYDCRMDFQPCSKSDDILLRDVLTLSR